MTRMALCSLLMVLGAGCAKEKTLAEQSLAVCQDVCDYAKECMADGYVATCSDDCKTNQNTTELATAQEQIEHYGCQSEIDVLFDCFSDAIDRATCATQPDLSSCESMRNTLLLQCHDRFCEDHPSDESCPSTDK